MIILSTEKIQAYGSKAFAIMNLRDVSTKLAINIQVYRIHHANVQGTYNFITYLTSNNFITNNFKT